MEFKGGEWGQTALRRNMYFISEVYRKSKSPTI